MSEVRFISCTCRGTSHGADCFVLNPPQVTFTSQGWQCPKCESVWAPHVDGCHYCNGQQDRPMRFA